MSKKLEDAAEDKPLNAKEKAFVDEYVKTGNAYDAAIKAGYNPSTAKSWAYLWTQPTTKEENPKAKPHIYAAIKEAQARASEEAEIDAVRILKEEVCIALCDPAEMYDDAGNLLPVHKMPESTRRSIASIKYDRQGNLTLRFNDKGSSLARLHKHLGCCAADKHEHNHTLSPEGELMSSILGQIDGSTRSISND